MKEKNKILTKEQWNLFKWSEKPLLIMKNFDFIISNKFCFNDKSHGMSAFYLAIFALLGEEF